MTVHRNQNPHESSHIMLWVKGKPGSGKSTIMKRLLDKTVADFGDGNICIAFFFSARGDIMERSRIGMYKSLTHQLVWKDRTVLQEIALLMEEKSKRYGTDRIEWQLKELENFFHSAIARQRSRRFTVLVDALDACNDEDVRKVVTAFERSAAAAVRNGTNLKICWSSRHYPHIKIRQSLEICMEEQNAPDIARYVDNALDGLETDDLGFDIGTKIIAKANGVFL